MSFSEFAAGLWALVTGGGVLVLALAYAFVLLQRRRTGGRSAVSGESLRPSGEARATGRALHPEDFVSCIAGVWLMLSPWILGSWQAGWLTASNVTFGAMIAIFALAAVYRLHPIEEWVLVVLAVWIFVSPWLMEPISAAIVWSNWITAAIVFVASVSSLVRLPRRPAGRAAFNR